LSVFNIVRAQEFINSPFLYEQDKYINEALLFTVIKPVDYDTLGAQDDSAKYFGFNPAIYLSNAYDVQNRQFITNSKIGVNLKFKYKALKVVFYPFYGIYRNNIFAEAIDTTGHLPHLAPVLSKLPSGFYSYLNFQGFVRYRAADFINFEIGRGRTFLGDGYRSLWLSDFSEPYTYFRSIAQIWRIKYLYQISFLADRNPQLGSGFFRKYNFTHLLSLNFFKRLNINMFETVMSAAYDDKGLHRGIELSYLNPVIFFRSVDLILGSPDNVIMGLGGSLRIFKNTRIYGQSFIDEFLIAHYLARKGYWDTKYGLQAGIKVYDLFNIRGLYFQTEANAVRPYTYSHNTMYLAYGNYYQPLAHPTGANFYEGLSIISYHRKNWFLQFKFIKQVAGVDDSLNNGKNIYLSYLSHYKETGNYITQGIRTELNYAEISFGYRYADFFTQIFATYRAVGVSRNLIIGMSVSFNAWDKRYWDWF